MFKSIIAPVQAWLLSHGQCVGCGTLLSKGTVSKSKSNQTLVTCKCGRIYVFERNTKKYRRALLEEV